MSKKNEYLMSAPELLEAWESVLSNRDPISKAIRYAELVILQGPSFLKKNPNIQKNIESNFQQLLKKKKLSLSEIVVLGRWYKVLSVAKLLNNQDAALEYIKKIWLLEIDNIEDPIILMEAVGTLIETIYFSEEELDKIVNKTIFILNSAIIPHAFLGYMDNAEPEAKGFYSYLGRFAKRLKNVGQTKVANLIFSYLEAAGKNLEIEPKKHADREETDIEKVLSNITMGLLLNENFSLKEESDFETIKVILEELLFNIDKEKEMSYSQKSNIRAILIKLFTQTFIISKSKFNHEFLSKMLEISKEIPIVSVHFQDAYKALLEYCTLHNKTHKLSAFLDSKCEILGKETKKVVLDGITSVHFFVFFNLLQEGYYFIDEKILEHIKNGNADSHLGGLASAAIKFKKLDTNFFKVLKERIDSVILEYRSAKEEKKDDIAYARALEALYILRSCKVML